MAAEALVDQIHYFPPLHLLAVAVAVVKMNQPEPPVVPAVAAMPVQICPRPEDRETHLQHRHLKETTVELVCLTRISLVEVAVAVVLVQQVVTAARRLAELVDQDQHLLSWEYQ